MIIIINNNNNNNNNNNTWIYIALISKAQWRLSMLMIKIKTTPGLPE